MVGQPYDFDKIDWEDFVREPRKTVIIPASVPEKAD